MHSLLGVRTALALVVAAIAAVASMLLNGDAQAGLVVLVCAAAAVLIAASGNDEAPAPSERAVPPAQDEPAIAEVIEAVSEPLLVIAESRVEAANQGARELLGQHVLGEDVRVAIRHPAAAERLMRADDGAPGAPIHLVGLGARDQRWEMRVHTLADGRRVVHLVDRTGNYAAERMRVDFVANASHELRTPLASIIGYIETLAEEGDKADPERRTFEVDVAVAHPHLDPVRVQLRVLP